MCDKTARAIGVSGSQGLISQAGGLDYSSSDLPIALHLWWLQPKVTTMTTN